MKKKVKVLIAITILIILLAILFVVINKIPNVEEKRTELEPDGEAKLETTNGITVVPTMNDNITSDSSWCGTFQLVWNDMKNEIVKKDIEFTPQEEIVVNLNKEDFNENMISDEYYFKIYGLKTLKLKEEIEKGIKEKFNQKSDILDDFDWSESALDNTEQRRYFLYAMLYRKFEFLQEFDKLKNGKFGNQYSDIEYFGINEDSKDSLGKQIEVLYYNSKDDFAIIVNTKTDDEVIFCKSPRGTNFNEIYDNMNNESTKYTGSKEFEDNDEFKAPNITFNEKREYTELENKEFLTADKSIAKIEKAIQTIKFSLNEKGGEIKSEAGIDVTLKAAMPSIEPKNEEPRYFHVDDTFAIFLREKGKSIPYFAGRIDDITKFQ